MPIVLAIASPRIRRLFFQVWAIDGSIGSWAAGVRGTPRMSVPESEGFRPSVRASPGKANAGGGWSVFEPLAAIMTRMPRGRISLVSQADFASIVRNFCFMGHVVPPAKAHSRERLDESWLTRSQTRSDFLQRREFVVVDVVATFSSWRSRTERRPGPYEGSQPDTDSRAMSSPAVCPGRPFA